MTEGVFAYLPRLGGVARFHEEKAVELAERAPKVIFFYAELSEMGY